MSLTGARAGPLRTLENRRRVHDEPTNSQDLNAAAGETKDANITRTLVWIGVAGLSAALAFTVVRSIVGGRKPADPTSERIQQLIDEANQLLKTLDDQRHTG